MSNSSAKFITVFIPTFNGEKYIGECIEAVLNQELPDGYKLELFIIDSGSKDKTVDTITEHYADKVRFMKIPNIEFGHGKTRQYAAEQAKGEYILFLSQDATPANYQWIKYMIEPFCISDTVGCVFGRQVPRPHSVPTIKREVAGVFAGLGPADAITLHRSHSLLDGQPVPNLNTFFSDVNSAIRKNLVTKVPFRDVKYAEDQALAQDMQEAGYLKAYAAQGIVWHSNEYTPKEYYHRKFDEYLGLQYSTAEKFAVSKKSLLLGWIHPTLADWKFIRHDCEYNRYVKFKYTLLAPAYNFYMQLGKYRAIKYAHDFQAHKKMSLEERRK